MHKPNINDFRLSVTMERKTNILKFIKWAFTWWPSHKCLTKTEPQFRFKYTLFKFHQAPSHICNKKCLHIKWRQVQYQNQSRWKIVIIVVIFVISKNNRLVPADSFLAPAPDTAFWLAGSTTEFGLLSVLEATDFREKILDVAFVKVFLKLLCLWHGEVSSLVSKGGDFARLRLFMWMAGRGHSLKKKKNWILKTTWKLCLTRSQGYRN